MVLHFVCLFCRLEGNFTRGRGGGTSWRGRGGGRGAGYGPPHIAQWPPQPRFYRPRHGQHPPPNQRPPPPWPHYGDVPQPPANHFPPPAYPRLPWGHQPARSSWDPRSAPVPPAPTTAWTPAGLLPPPPGSHILPQSAGLQTLPVTAVTGAKSGSVGNPRPQLDTRYIQNSTLQHQAASVATPPSGTRPSSLHVFPFGPQQFGGTPHFTGQR